MQSILVHTLPTIFVPNCSQTNRTTSFVPKEQVVRPVGHTSKSKNFQVSQSKTSNQKTLKTLKTLTTLETLKSLETLNFVLKFQSFLGVPVLLNLEKMLDKKPSRPLEAAVSGMLPKNKLRKDMMDRLKLFAGEDHIYSAQKPETLSL